MTHQYERLISSILFIIISKPSSFAFIEYVDKDYKKILKTISFNLSLVSSGYLPSSSKGVVFTDIRYLIPELKLYIDAVNALPISTFKRLNLLLMLVQWTVYRSTFVYLQVQNNLTMLKHYNTKLDKLNYKKVIIIHKEIKKTVYKGKITIYYVLTHLILINNFIDFTTRITQRIPRNPFRIIYKFNSKLAFLFNNFYFSNNKIRQLKKH
jgi:hypothetical protein